ncbi:tapasin-related protein-like [Bufo gargarizans]|uniref:tapasin-related protein-like n=1 Tax=Bufo gargarizans TaxID=30331 RepID=UPI001CF308E1|nr:tapasin-related protein-like [Bufo gargarizans]
MKTMGLLHLGFILTLHSVVLWGAAVPHLQYAVDILLPCDYALLDSSMGGMGFTRQSVTLVLQNVTVMGEEPADPLPNYHPPENPEMTVFLATADLAPLLFAERLLHVECEGEKVECEISPIYSQLFTAHIRLPELSIAVMARATVPIDRPDELANDKTVVPMTVDFLVSSSPPSQKRSLTDEVTLNCDVWSSTEVSVDWHLQKDGTGHRLNLEDSRITLQQETQEKKVASSLTIRQLHVHDEGTYICAVTSGQHKLQQILQLQIREPPQVTVSVSADPKTTVTCRTDRYYPLDVEVTWLLNGSPLTDISPITSSHRKNNDGTYSLSNFLQVPVPQTGASPDTYTCAVSHVSVTDPIMVEVNVLPEQADVSDTIILTIMFTIILILTLITSLFLWKKIQREEKKKA